MPPMVRLGRASGAAAVAVAMIAAIACLFAASASAGFNPDPLPGDQQLGKAGGIAYVRDDETTVTPSFTVVLTGCPTVGGAWRITGGGFATSLPVNFINATRPMDLLDALGDDDTDPDDYWEVESGLSASGSTLSGWSICMKEPKLKYKTETAPPSDDPGRSFAAGCPGKTKPTGGGGFISSTGSFLGSLYPSGRSWKAAAHNAENDSNFTADFACLKSKRVKTVSKTVRVTANTSITPRTLCPATSHVLGGGVKFAGPAESGLAFESAPIDGSDADQIPDDGWRAGVSNQTAGTEKAGVYATCLGKRK